MKNIVYLLLFAIAFISCKDRSNAAHKKTTKKESPIMVISCERTACYGNCPVFDLQINPNDTAYLTGIKHTSFIGRGECKLPEGTFKKIVKILEEMHIRELKEKYAINVTDNPTAYLKITFEDFSHKKIEDYGLKGTPELEKLYKKLDSLVLNTNWIKMQDE